MAAPMEGIGADDCVPTGHWCGLPSPVGSREIQEGSPAAGGKINKKSGWLRGILLLRIRSQGMWR